MTVDELRSALRQPYGAVHVFADEVEDHEDIAYPERAIARVTAVPEPQVAPGLRMMRRARAIVAAREARGAGDFWVPTLCVLIGSPIGTSGARWISVMLFTPGHGWAPYDGALVRYAKENLCM
jgi:hypothetical protein